MRVVIRRSIYLLMLMLVTSPVAAAQDVLTISGAVTTRVDGMPVPGAVVSIVGADTSNVTDANGHYTIPVPNRLVRSRRLQLQVDALGLPPKLIDVAVDAASLTVDVALTVEFSDGKKLKEIVVEYPIGHKRRRKEGMPVLVEKFKTNLARRFPAKRQKAILDLCLDPKKLAATPVNEFVDMMVI